MEVFPTLGSVVHSTIMSVFNAVTSEGLKITAKFGEILSFTIYPVAFGCLLLNIEMCLICVT